MSFLPDFKDLDILGSNCYTLVSGGSFDSISFLLENSVANTPIIIEAKEFGTYAWQKITIQNLDAAGQAFTITLDDNFTAGSANYCQASFNIPAQSKLDIYLPYILGLRKIAINANCLFQVTNWKLRTLPFVPASIDTAWGGTDGVATANTGVVTNNGFNSAEVHSWTVNSGQTGGINYTVTPVPVALSTWYSLLLTTAVAITAIINSVTYTIRGSVKFAWDSISFGNANCSMVNASTNPQTVTAAFSQVTYNANTNAWYKSNTVGA